jgi:hypothetical protein
LDLLGRVDEFEGLDFTELGEDACEYFLSCVVGEILHEQVAPLFGDLELDGFVFDGFNPIRFFHHFSNIERFFRSRKHFPVHFLYCLLGTFRTVLSFLGDFTVETEEVDVTLHSHLSVFGLLNLFCLLLKMGRNSSEGSEQFQDPFSRIVVARDVFDEDGIECPSRLALQLGVELDRAETLTFYGGRESFLSSHWILEADEAVSARFVILVERNFAGYDVSKFTEGLFEFTRVKVILWDLPDENILILDLGNVRARQLNKVGQSSDRVVMVLEVAELLDG